MKLKDIDKLYKLAYQLRSELEPHQKCMGIERIRMRLADLLWELDNLEDDLQKYVGEK